MSVALQDTGCGLRAGRRRRASAAAFGLWPEASSLDRQPGFTLIEILVVVGVIALLASLAGPAIGTLTGANAREAAGKLAGGMRYLFDTAALRHATCRMALDLDNRSWSAECAQGAAAIARGREAREDGGEPAPGERGNEIQRLVARTRFGAFSDRLVEGSKLPGNAAFGPVHVEGRREADKGKAYVYFFPGGQAQRAFVPVVDGGNIFTIVVEPFTGRARVVKGAVEVSE